MICKQLERITRIITSVLQDDNRLPAVTHCAQLTVTLNRAPLLTRPSPRAHPSAHWRCVASTASAKQIHKIPPKVVFYQSVHVVVLEIEV